MKIVSKQAIDDNSDDDEKPPPPPPPSIIRKGKPKYISIYI